jgi:FlaA1/EpsC-like NDP-sugar epimerase
MYNIIKELENKIVVITGGSGYIGSALIEKLVYL